jgi:hypothetical protein
MIASMDAISLLQQAGNYGVFKQVTIVLYFTQNINKVFKETEEGT